jgi:3'-5' exonuclease
MLDSINLKQLLFIDIETVPQLSAFELLPKKLQDFWEKKSSYFRSEDQTATEVYQRAGIYAEFGKIICISVGAVTGEKENYGLKLKSFIDEDEKKLLNDFAGMLEALEKKSKVIFCAHNGKEFDYPYLSRRFLVNGLKLPQSLDNSAKKPWEVQHLDTLELWKFGDYKHYTSLDLLATIFNIASSKEEIDGSMIADIYYKERDFPKIKKYCESDVIVVAQLIMSFLNLPLIPSDKIISSGD